MTLGTALRAAWDALGYGDARVAVAVIEALAHDTASRGRIVELALEAEETSVRVAALRILASDPESIATRRHACRASSAPVREAALASLAHDPFSRELAIELLLSDPSYSVRAAAVPLVAADRMGRALLLEVLAQPRARSALGALQLEDALALALAEEPRAWDALLDRLEQMSVIGRDAVVAALASRPAERQRARAHFAHDSALVRASVVRALARDPASWTAVEACFEDVSRVVRDAAILATCSDPRVATRRAALLGDESADVVLRAAAIQTMQPGEEPLVRALLGHPDRTLRMTSALSLSRDRESLEARRALLDDPIRDVRCCAVRSLRAEDAYRPAIRAALVDPDASVVAAAIRASAGDPEAIPALRARIDAGPVVGRAAIEVLAATDPASLPLLRRRLWPSPRPPRPAPAPLTIVEADIERLVASVEAPAEGIDCDPAQHAAVRALAGRPEASAALRNIVENSDEWYPSIVADALRGLHAGAVDVDTVRTLLEDVDEEDGVRVAAAQHLAQVESERDALARYLDHGTCLLKVALIPFFAQDPAAHPALRVMLGDLDPRVRVAASAALRATRPRDDGRELAPILQLRPAASRVDLEAAVYAAGSDRALLEQLEGVTPEAASAWILRSLASDPSGVVQPDAEVAPGEPRCVRIPVDEAELARSRGFFPLHALLEVLSVTQRLTAPEAPCFWLACADVAFADLVFPELSPGQACFGPGLYGLRLARA